MTTVKNAPGFALLAVLLLSVGLTASESALAQSTHRKSVEQKTDSKPTAFQYNNGLIPPRSVYSGPFFILNHDWPARPLPPLSDRTPWQAAINGKQISPQNAGAYANALRQYVSENARNLIMNYDTWDAKKARWYNEPWLGSKREAIHGTYNAGNFSPDIFPGTGLRVNFTTHAVTYYDERATYSLYKTWGASATRPSVTTQNVQFAEGSVIVKAAIFTSTDPTQPTNWWDAMNGAQVWSLYMSPDGKAPVQVWPGYVAQFDIIVKDSQSAPKTGWVFTTLVYDSSQPGDAWDKMIPLGAQWGNDPQATKPGDTLVENWVNPNAPKYSTQTLGWLGRLSGPNDGATNDIAVNGKVEKNEPDSSCMSCHSTAQWNVETDKMDSFLLPSFPPTAIPPKAPFQTCGDDGKPSADGENICSPEQASAAWMKWFLDRKGTEPMDAGSVATDFDEVFSFKSFPLWWAANSGQSSILLEVPGHTTRFNQYTGAPIRGSSTAQ